MWGKKPHSDVLCKEHQPISGKQKSTAFCFEGARGTGEGNKHYPGTCLGEGEGKWWKASKTI